MPDRLVVITGTSRGVGRGLAEHFANAGDVVAGCSRGASTLNDLPGYRHWSVNVSNEHSVRSWAREVKHVYERGPDVLICNAGIVKLGALTGLMTFADFQESVNVTLAGTFLACREFCKQMTLQRSGRIINITSIMTELHEPGTAAYASAKAGVVEFTKVLATELATSGITCNVLSPSVITGESSSAFGEDWMQRMLAMQTLKRPISIDDIYHIVEFLASSQASCITGQVIHTCLVD